MCSLEVTSVGMDASINHEEDWVERLRDNCGNFVECNYKQGITEGRALWYSTCLQVKGGEGVRYSDLE